jgi:hypothetical protein
MDVLPQLGRDESREVAHVRRGDDEVRNAQAHCLTCDDRIGINGSFTSSRLAATPRVRPEQSRVAHCRRANRQILRQSGEAIQSRNSFGTVCAQ